MADRATFVGKRDRVAGGFRRRRLVGAMAVAVGIVLSGAVGSEAAGPGDLAKLDQCTIARCKEVSFDSKLTTTIGVTFDLHSLVVLTQTAPGSGVFEGTGPETETATPGHRGIGCTETAKDMTPATMSVRETILGPKAGDVRLALDPGKPMETIHFHCVTPVGTTNYDTPPTPFWSATWNTFHSSELSGGLDRIQGFVPYQTKGSSSNPELTAIKTYDRTFGPPQAQEAEHTKIITDLYDPCRYVVKSVTGAGAVTSGNSPLRSGTVLGDGQGFVVNPEGSVTLTNDLGNDIVIDTGLVRLDRSQGCVVAEMHLTMPPKHPASPPPVKTNSPSLIDKIMHFFGSPLDTFNTSSDALAGGGKSRDAEAASSSPFSNIFSVSVRHSVTKVCATLGRVRVTATLASGHPSVVISGDCATVAGTGRPKVGPG